MFVGIVPVRISFAGGGTDMPEYYEKFGGNVVSTNINQFTYLMIKLRRDRSFQVFSSDFKIHQSTTNFKQLKPKTGTEIAVSVVKHLGYENGADFLMCSDVPPGSGLGASSSLTVNFVNTILTLQHKKWSQKKIAETAFHVERNLLHQPIGKQDDYISAFGGFNYIKFRKNNVKVVPIKLTKSTLFELESNLLLFFLGTTRNSAVILSKQLQFTASMKKSTITALHYALQLGEELYDSLRQSDLQNFGKILHQGWLAKQKFVKGVTNKKIDKIYEASLKAGCVGGKLTGAGAGGHLLLYCEKSKQRRVIDKMKKIGLSQIKFRFNQGGAKVLNLYDFVK